MTFDTYKAFLRLTQAGFTDEQAEAIIDVIAEAVGTRGTMKKGKLMTKKQPPMTEDEAANYLKWTFDRVVTSIIYGAALDEFTGRYAPTGQIVWHSRKGKHGAHSFALSELFSTG